MTRKDEWIHSQVEGDNHFSEKKEVPEVSAEEADEMLEKMWEEDASDEEAGRREKMIEESDW